jgi:hypothetical protein
MARTARILAGMLDFGDVPEAVAGQKRRSPGGIPGGLRIAARCRISPGPEKYRILDLKRRRAQIRARRVLDLVG